ncbi:uncharacterized protein BO97DRAFT_442475 [Aspergillus homomorphus CBS 101889]|uniref:F-box domain-containing protein n=1 Tax=Aspergillus homomorphus (strain CBS 101889) TaxID=1450537 RepID=A0A395HZU9_ASPHC|nr:hypothetical protein BO97DRAFT_442475 [Aspergillus homomorphus CBS 101889]RAL13472.1 hypothetical protein BO97DRAFT_442475 [Aspergillus homomorphus CBS 101889]
MSNPEPKGRRLHDLSPEIFQQILTDLDPESIKALRLTTRTLAEKCLGPRDQLIQPVLDFSPQNLRALYALACDPVLSPKVHSLTFLATSLEFRELEKSIEVGYYEEVVVNGPIWSREEVDYTPEELDKAQAELRWLKEQQEARAAESPSEMVELLQRALQGFGALQSIRLDGGIVRGRGRTKREPPGYKQWKPLWERASQVLSWVLTAMVQTGVSVRDLDVYYNTDRCCIPVDEIAALAAGLDQSQRELFGNNLQSFQLSLSGALKDAHVEKAEEGKEEVGEKDEPLEIQFLFQSASALRELDLRFRRTGRLETLHCYNYIIDNISKKTQFPMLEKCVFAGLAVKEESLLLFLRKHPNLRSLSLHECHLSSGSWTPIFTHLQSMSRLETLSLSNLFGKHMQNRKYEQQRYGSSSSSSGSSTSELEIEEDDEQEVDGMVVLLPIWNVPSEDRWAGWLTEYPHSNGRAVHTRDFTREELAKGLVFRPLAKGPGRAIGSAQGMNWRNSRQELYAPLIDEKRQLPVNSVILTCVFSALLALINVGSETAFNAVVSLNVAALMFSYAISMSCLIWRKLYHPEALPPARWGLGRYGLAVNITGLVYVLPALFWFFWLSELPIAADTFNWSVVIFVAVFVPSLVMYVVKGRREYEGPVTLVKECGHDR